jgi:hypothetical protein
MLLPTKIHFGEEIKSGVYITPMTMDSIPTLWNICLGVLQFVYCVASFHPPCFLMKEEGSNSKLVTY